MIGHFCKETGDGTEPQEINQLPRTSEQHERNHFRLINEQASPVSFFRVDDLNVSLHLPKHLFTTHLITLFVYFVSFFFFFFFFLAFFVLSLISVL